MKANRKLLAVRRLTVAAVRVLTFGAVAVNAQAATPAIEWEQVFGGEERGQSGDYVVSLLALPDGGFLVGGNTSNQASGTKESDFYGIEDYWILRTDALGGKIWELDVGGQSFDFLKAVLPTPDGGFLAVGDSISSVSGSKTERRSGHHVWLVWMDASGNVTRQQTYGRSGAVTADVWHALASEDGGYLLAGSAVGARRADAWLLKIAENGEESWEVIAGGSGADRIVQVVPASDGGYLLLCRSDSTADGDKESQAYGGTDFWVIKLTPERTIQWQRSYGGDSADSPASMLATTDGGFIISGTSFSGATGTKTVPTFGSLDMWVFKINSSGDVLWEKAYGGDADDILEEMVQMDDGTLLAAGSSASGTSGNKESPRIGDSFAVGSGWVLLLNPAGEKIWELALGGTRDDWIRSVAIGADGGILLGGSSDSGIGGTKTIDRIGVERSNDMWLVKLAGASPGELRLLNPRWSNDRFQADLSTKPGRSYALEARSRFGNLDWTEVGRVSGDGTIKTLIGQTTEPSGFFRAAERPE